MTAITMPSISRFLDSIFHERKQASAIRVYHAEKKSINERLKNLINGDPNIKMEGLCRGEWFEVVPGLMVMYTDVTPHITLMEGHAIADVELTEPHCHMTVDGPKNEVFFIREGYIDFCIHDGDSDKVIARVRRGEGEMMPLYPNDWHTIKMDNGTKFTVAIHPHV